VDTSNVTEYGPVSENYEESESNVQRREGAGRILIEGMTVDEMLTLPDEYIATLVAAGPFVFKAGSAEILGQIRLRPDSLMIELAQIDGGGEGVLPVLLATRRTICTATGIGRGRMGRSRH